MCLGRGAVSFAPIIANIKPPIPMIFLGVLSLLSIYLSFQVEDNPVLCLEQIEENYCYDDDGAPIECALINKSSDSECNSGSADYYEETKQD